ncbi:baseplate J/gp47 family protein [Shewanella sp. D64]|uniref:baseplate J/gp47 family protein n=1 Tax=unclassified Shewanella TaxID=196818 RepID=UPI0022BA149E|nr:MULTISPECIES: baseplate J/gp47 family protein [unclassified Shewanella]MEC4728166.1 baseplate J/gp47 family protein [Shewanella sp. D64]MEC4740286.1 baseplate J/gp47 family protein [Shewanella sp. E94]WBJ94399.1 baseplate J/gp47 family protein [Shewanella sp. MTB7]
MSTQRSLSALVERAKSTLIAKTGQHNPAIDAIACAIAGVSYGQYGYQDQLFRELSPETASEPWLYLHAQRHDVERLLPSFARGWVRFKQLGEVVLIPKGSVVVAPSGNEYLTLNQQYSDVNVEVIALMSGVSSNLPNDTVLTLSEAISGISPNDVLSVEINGGADIEDIEHWRERICMAYNQGVLVGRRSDYEAWARSAHADVDYAWALDNTPELGMVQVFIGTRQQNPALPLAVVDTVQAYIESVRLAGCHPTVMLPTQKPVNIEIQNVQDEHIQADITKALDALFMQKMGQRDHSVIPPRPVSLSPTEIVIAIAPITSNYLVRRPTEEQFIANNEIHTLGEITWTPLT